MNRKQSIEEIPAISSSLRWAEVSLPEPISEAEIDSIVFSTLTPGWQKMALVVGLAYERCKQFGLPISDEALAARIQVLVDSNRVEGQGDLRKWRFSEVRLKD